MADLYHLREQELDSATAPMLAPLIAAYRPHTNPEVGPSSKELDYAGCGMKDILDTYRHFVDSEEDS